ncbi:MAG TPA: YggS family pyridoxal phosphate-dependent enzyme [Candidatus Brocadiia bacterium]|nr:YggS family pyridoxal phosphate-dependent enzyme [Candidatus Brocadiia bacterium]
MADDRLNRLKENLAAVRNRIADACARCGRSPDSVRLVAVCKTVGPDAVRALYDLGQLDFGENRVQTGLPKIAALKDLREIRWHMIGHLQRNKAKKTIQEFRMIHSVDSEPLAAEIAARAGECRMTMPAMLEVNVSGEESKFGVKCADVAPLAGRIRRMDGIRLEGLMTMAPFTDDMEVCRGVFRTLRELRDSINADGDEPFMTELSMGMSQDFEIAVEEGSTCVRIGTALFEGWTD